jgi:putative tryptophan/tyrosine transport system substrate-binding protein
VLRRDVIALIGGAAVAWPLAAQAQQSAMPVVGFIVTSSPAKVPRAVAGFRAGLEETGYVEGKNVAIEYRGAEGRYDRLPALVDELVSLRVAVISTGGYVASLAAKREAVRIPIVFTVGVDPVKLGLVTNITRPGGNATGIADLTVSLTLKRLELISELVPRTSAVGFLVNPENKGVLVDVQDAAQSIGRRVFTVEARGADEFEAAFASFAKAQVGGLLVAGDAFFNAQRERLIALAANYALPAIYEFPEFPAEGGLMSYGPNPFDLFRLVGVYTGRILDGAKPSDLPVQQPTKFELVINLKTAKALGLTIPPSLLARADEVIE